MLEQRRVDYLRNMGITLWMPRKALPHAPESRWLPEDNNERHEHIPIRHAGESSRPVAAADLLRAGQPMHKREEAPTSPVKSISADAPQSPVREQVPAAELVVESTPNIVDMTPPRFVLEFIPVSHRGLWVVDGSQTEHNVPHFAYRVLKGMGLAPDLIHQPIAFRWPFIESSHQDQSEPIALQALNAQWQFFKGQGIHYIVTVGDEAYRWMSKINAQSHHHLVDLPTLQQSAQLKRELWLALQQLPEV